MFFNLEEQEAKSFFGNIISFDNQEKKKSLVNKRVFLYKTKNNGKQIFFCFENSLHFLKIDSGSIKHRIIQIIQ